jgi:hypothetical protein
MIEQNRDLVLAWKRILVLEPNPEEMIQLVGQIVRRRTGI